MIFAHEDIVRITGAQADGQADVSAIVTDSRRVRDGELFVALIGEKMDGHDYCQNAMQQGAAAVLVQKKVDVDIPMYVVPDTLVAYQQLAGAHREKFVYPFLAITGTNGKTTTKEMCAAILRSAGKPLVSYGNHNNHIGVPETLLRCSDEYTYAVTEMGMNHRGEISLLTQLTKPTVGVITNIGRGHLEGVGTQDEVAAAKMEIFEGMNENSIAILPSDSTYIDTMRATARDTGCVCVTFGIASDADVHVEIKKVELTHTLCTITVDKDSSDCHLPLPGAHNANNAAAAIAAARAAAPELTLDACVDALENMRGVQLRSECKEIDGITCILDCYNANPESTRALLDWDAEIPCRGKRWAVLGDMNELGDESSALHYEIGTCVATSGINMLITTGKYSAMITAGARDAGMQPDAIIKASGDEIASLLNRELLPGDRVLFKASRTVQLEDVMHLLMKKRNENAA